MGILIIVGDFESFFFGMAFHSPLRFAQFPPDPVVTGDGAWSLETKWIGLLQHDMGGDQGCWGIGQSPSDRLLHCVTVPG